MDLDRVKEMVWSAAAAVCVFFAVLILVSLSGCSTSGGTTTANQTIVSLIYVGDLGKKDEDCITTDPAD